MIIAEGKPIKEILAMIDAYDKIIVAGCKGCVTVCSAGGEKEVSILSSALRLARQTQGRSLEIKEVTLERQCDTEYLEPMREYADQYPAILSLACGAGIQFVAEKFRKHPVLPGVNTQFIGVTEEQGVWTERCQSCGNCMLDRTGGICVEQIQRLRKIEGVHGIHLMAIEWEDAVHTIVERAGLLPRPEAK